MPPDALDAEREDFIATVVGLTGETAQALHDLRVLLQRVPSLGEGLTQLWLAAAIAQEACDAVVMWNERRIGVQTDPPAEAADSGA